MNVQNEACHAEAVPPLNGYGQAFNSLTEAEQQVWLEAAEHHLERNQWHWQKGPGESNHATVMYITAVYLFELSKRAITAQFPHYVVVSQDKPWRFTSADFVLAARRFRVGVREGERVAMFIWTTKDKCQRLHASDDYTLGYDFGAPHLT